MDPNVNVEIKSIPDFNIELPISKETTKNILEPALVPLGQAIGGIVNWVFKKPIEYGIVRNAELNNLKAECNVYFNKIPAENRTSKNLGLTLKAFEDSRYQLSNNILIEYFSKLIAGTVDNRENVQPVFSSILSEMTTQDAELLKYFSQKKILFKNQISHSNPFFSDERYRHYSKLNFFKITDNYTEGMHREPEKFSEIYADKILEVNSIEDSFLFLVSKGLISIDESENSHVLIYVIENKMLKSNKWLSDMVEEFSNYKYNRITNQTTQVYSLTSLGRSLADLICTEV